MAAVDDVNAKEHADRLIAEAKEFAASGDTRKAARRYAKAAAAFAPYASFALVAGDMFYSERRFEEASIAYRAVVEAVPEHDQAWHGLGWSLLNSGDYDQGRAALVTSQALAAGIERKQVSTAIEEYFLIDDPLERGRLIEGVARSDDERIPWLLHQHAERAALIGTAIGDLDHWRSVAIAMVRLGVRSHLDWYTDGPAPNREWVIEDVERYLAEYPDGPPAKLWPVAYGPGDEVPRPRAPKQRRRWLRRWHTGA
jgi:tetratricopeptide (TPR) repeat protein